MDKRLIIVIVILIIVLLAVYILLGSATPENVTQSINIDKSNVSGINL
jgi:preprotein translocase subunit SecG